MRTHFRIARALVLMSGVAACSISSKAISGDLVYTPVNPSFGGSPLNSNHLLGTANAQNEYKTKADAARSAGYSPTDAFIQMLQSRLYSSLADAVSNAIFGPNAQQSGTVTFSDQQVAFVNTGTEIRLTITNFATGKVTEIVVPTLVTN